MDLRPQIGGINTTNNSANWVQYEMPNDLIWGVYRKAVPIRAAKVRGKFIVNRPEGMMTCQDGYLCMDSQGRFYPLETREFEAVYARLYEGQGHSEEDE